MINQRGVKPFFPLEGTTLGRDYVTLIKGIAAGGMGTIYKGKFDLAALIREGVKGGEISSSVLQISDSAEGDNLERKLEENTCLLRERLRGYSAEEIGVLMEFIDPRIKSQNFECAVKVLGGLVELDERARERFLRESEIAVKAHHKNIVGAFGVGHDKEKDIDFFIMELLKPVINLNKISRPFPSKIVRHVGLSVLNALEYIHGKGIIHRDIKPSNIMVCEDLEGDITIDEKRVTIKLADLGLAKAGESKNKITLSGTVMGTAAYMSPEQARGESATHKSDIYSLGTSLYYISTGRLPFEGESAIATLSKVLNEESELPQSVNSEIPDWLQVYLMMSMAKDIGQRPDVSQSRILLNNEKPDKTLEEKIKFVEERIRLIKNSGRAQAIASGAASFGALGGSSSAHLKAGSLEIKSSKFLPIAVGIVALAGTIGGIIWYNHEGHRKKIFDLENLVAQTEYNVLRDKAFEFKEGERYAEEIMDKLSGRDSSLFRRRLKLAETIWRIDDNLDRASSLIESRKYAEAKEFIASAKSQIEDANDDFTDNKFLARYEFLRGRRDETERALEEHIKADNLEDILADIKNLFEEHNYINVSRAVARAGDILKELPADRYTKQKNELGEYSARVVPKLLAIENFEKAVNTIKTLEEAYVPFNSSLEEGQEIEDREINNFIDSLKSTGDSLERVYAEGDVITDEQYDKAREMLQGMEGNVRMFCVRNNNILAGKFKSSLSDKTFNMEEAALYMGRIAEEMKPELEDYINVYMIEQKLLAGENDISYHQKAEEIYRKIGCMERAQYHMGQYNLLGRELDKREEGGN